MASVRKSLMLSLGERGVTFVMQITMFVVIARLLTPEEIGIYSVSIAIVGLAQVLRDFGLGSYLIQETELTQNRLRTVFTLMLGIGLLLFVVMQLSRTAIAGYYEDNRLDSVLSVLAYNFLIIPFGAIGLSLLRRDMRFERSVVINLTAGVIGFLTVLTMAWSGFSYWALVASSLVVNIITAIMAGMLSPAKVAYALGLSEWRRVLSFGSRVSATDTLTVITANLNELIVGKALGFSGLAMLSRAQGVMNLLHRDLTAAIQRVAYPAFAQTFRAGLDVESVYRRAVCMVTALAWPFYGLLALFPLELIRLLFGTQWDQSASIVPVYCAAGAIGATWSLINTQLLAIGRVDLAFKFAYVIQPLKFLAFLVVMLIAPSLLKFALAELFVFFVTAIAAYRIKKSFCKTTWTQLFNTDLMPSLKLALYSLAGPIVLKTFTVDLQRDEFGFTVFLIACVLCMFGWVVGLIRLSHPLYQDPFFAKPRKAVERLLGWVKSIPWRKENEEK